MTTVVVHNMLSYRMSLPLSDIDVTNHVIGDYLRYCDNSEYRFTFIEL